MRAVMRISLEPAMIHLMARSFQIADGRSELAVRFDGIAAHADKRNLRLLAERIWAPKLTFPIGVGGSSVPGCWSHETYMVVSGERR
jgi:hypothetical protein